MSIPQYSPKAHHRAPAPDMFQAPPQSDALENRPLGMTGCSTSENLFLDSVLWFSCLFPCVSYLLFCFIYIYINVCIYWNINKYIYIYNLSSAFFSLTFLFSCLFLFVFVFSFFFTIIFWRSSQSLDQAQHIAGSVSTKPVLSVPIHALQQQGSAVGAIDIVSQLTKPTAKRAVGG